MIHDHSNCEPICWVYDAQRCEMLHDVVRVDTGACIVHCLELPLRLVGEEPACFTIHAHAIEVVMGKTRRPSMFILNPVGNLENESERNTLVA